MSSACWLASLCGQFTSKYIRFRYLHQSPRGPPHRRTAESVRLRPRGRQSGHNHGRRAQLKPSLEKEIPLFSKHRFRRPDQAQWPRCAHGNKARRNGGGKIIRKARAAFTVEAIEIEHQASFRGVRNRFPHQKACGAQVG